MCCCKHDVTMRAETRGRGVQPRGALVRNSGSHLGCKSRGAKGPPSDTGGEDEQCQSAEKKLRSSTRLGLSGTANVSHNIPGSEANSSCHDPNRCPRLPDTSFSIKGCANNDFRFEVYLMVREPHCPPTCAPVCTPCPTKTGNQLHDHGSCPRGRRPEPTLAMASSGHRRS